MGKNTIITAPLAASSNPARQAHQNGNVVPAHAWTIGEPAEHTEQDDQGQCQKPIQSKGGNGLTSFLPGTKIRPSNRAGAQNGKGR